MTTSETAPNSEVYVALEYIFDKNELDWLRDKNEVYIYFPRMVHNSTKLLEPRLGEFNAYGADFYVKTSGAELINARHLSIEINFTNLPWFGPADLPILIIQHDSLATIQEKISFQQFSGQLNKQFDIGLPLLILIFCLFFNHKKIFVLLSLLALLKATRSFFAYAIDYNSSHPSIELAYIIVVFLFFPAFLYFLYNYFSVKNRYVIPSFTLFFLSATSVYLHYFSNSFLQTFDLFVDASISVIGLLLILHHLLRASLRHDHTIRPVFSRQNVELFLLVFIFSSTAYSNFSDLMLFNKGIKPNGFQIGHYVLFPGLFSAMLIRYGGVWRQMQGFALKFARTEMMQNQFDLGYKYQKSLLPPKKWTSSKYSWRTFFWPGFTLGGDWLSIENISNTKDWVIATIVDVTGQGVAAAMQTGVIANAVLSAIKHVERHPSFAQLSHPRDVLNLILNKLDESYGDSLQNLTFSSAFVVIDVDDKNVAIANFAHPGVVLLNNRSLRYLPAKNSFFSTMRSSVVLDHLKIESGNKILLLSDGFLPTEVSLPLWLQAEHKKNRSSQSDFMSHLLTELRKRRHDYRNRREKAAVDLDDAAAIQISIS